jgi:ubiquinone/menaquinone biosynthesis C-methylase UbiE
MLQTALAKLLPIEHYARLRTLAFTAERLTLPIIQTVLEQRAPRFLRTENPELFRAERESILRLLTEDVENIRKGIYPLSVLTPESPRRHLLRIPRLFLDGLFSAYRRQKRVSKAFSKEAYDQLSEVPDYYRRNFHFQQDGYLSTYSAELYDHQVEVLFTGAAHAMRRLLLPPLKNHLNSEGEGCKFLELAAGCGSATRFVKLTFPKAHITGIDLSEPYLKKAKRDLAHFTRLDFLKADAAQLPFHDSQYDVVYSVFLFHELPREEREKVFQESFRMLKPGGVTLVVDSLQINDVPVMNPALEQFPLDFHEPFYKSYIETPLKDLLQNAGFKVLSENYGFYSKVVMAQKI